MRNHLSADQFSALTIRAATDNEWRHVGDCAECAAKLDRMKDAFSFFRDSVQQWAQANGASFVPNSATVPNRSSSFKLLRLRWAVLTVALILLIGLPIYKRANDHRKAEAPLASAVDDAMLLEQVNEQLLRRVPEPMEPWMQLLSNVSVQEVGDHQ
jgi:hypothetical protein